MWKAEESLDITITNDDLDEDDETFVLEIEYQPGTQHTPLVDADGNSCGSKCTVTVTITDDDTAGVTVSESSLTVTEEDTTGDTYTVVLDSQPTANVTISIGGQSGTDVTAAPTPMTFTPTNWATPVTVTVTGDDDADLTNDMVTLTHNAVSTDGDYQGITIAGLTVTAEDNDTAQVMGLMVEPGNAQLVVQWTAVANATGYQVQWKSGVQSYNNSGRQSTIGSGTTTSHTIPSLTNATEYTVRVRATRTGANNGAYSAEVLETPVMPTAAGVTVSKSALTVTEQDTTGDSYTVVLDRLPTASVTVTVGGLGSTDVTANPASLTFTTVNWETAQMVTVTAGNDADTTNDTVSLTHSAASSDSAYQGITIAGVTVTVNDNDTAQVTGLMIEPGNAQLVVGWTAVSNATGYEVQWKSGGQSYNNSGRQATIGSGSTTSHTIPSLTNATEYTVRVRATRTGANNGTYSAEVLETPVMPTAAGVTVSESALTVTEQDTTGDTYTVVLDRLPTASVTVTVGGLGSSDVTANPASLTFTTGNWATAQTVTVTAGNDADTTNDTVSLTHSAASTDTDYDGITVAGVTVTVNDNDTAQVTGLTIEPGNAQLAVEWTAVTNATGYEVQWKSGGQSYNNSRQATISSGSTTSHTIPSLNNGTAYTVRVRATRTGANSGAYSAEVVKTPVMPTAAGVTVSKSALTVTEQDSTGDSYTVVLDRLPTASVTVTVSGHVSTDVTPAPASLTFTTGNWETAQTVTVTAGNDTDTTNDMISLTHSAASSDGAYQAITIAGVTVTVNDNDTAQVMGVMVAPGNARLVVQWTAVTNATGYKVQWKSGGQGYNNSRQATIGSGSTTSHTISSLTNDTAYTVRVIATRTGANDGPESDEVTKTPVMPTTEGVTVSKSALTVTEQDTIGDTYTVVLDTQPTASVTVTVGGLGGSDVTANPATLTFTTGNWQTAKTVTVKAAGDTDTTNDTVSLTHSAASTDSAYDGITIAGVTVMVEDNDIARVTGLMITPGDGQLVVRWTAVSNATGYEVQWKSGGQDYNSGNRQATIGSGSTTSHTIPSLNNGTAYTVRVRATRTGANSGAYSAEVMETPVMPTPGTTMVTFGASSYTAWEGGAAATVAVELSAALSSEISVRVVQPSADDYTGVPATITFGVNETSLSFTITATQDTEAESEERFLLTLQVEQGLGVTYGDHRFTTVVIIDDDTPGMTVLPSGLAVDEGVGATYTVTLNSVPTGDVTVAITSSDPGAATVVPATLTFTPLDWNAAKTVTVTGVEDGDRNDESVTLRNNPSGGGYDGVGTEEVALSVADNDSPGVRVSRTTLTVREENTNGDTYTVVLSIQPTASVTVTVGGFSGTDVTANPASLIFTTLNWDTPQTVTVTAAGDADTANDTVTLTHSAASADGDYQGVTIAGVTVTVTDNDGSVLPPPRITGGGGGGFGAALVAPQFADGFRTSRPLGVNARAGDAVGDPVAATHPNDDDVTYSLSGADAALFTVDEETGQLRLAQGATLEVGQTYTVNLTATDSSGTGAIIIVVIAVAEGGGDPYDLNRNGTIEKNEVLAAIADYFAGLMEKDDVLTLVARYFAV